MKSLVTGANGFLGAWLCQRLLNEGHDVTALIRKNSDLTEIQNLKLKYAYGDVTNKESLEPAFRNQDYIFHLAGVVAYKKSERDLMNHVNVTGTQNVVDVIAKQKTSRLLHLSSVVAIGASFNPVMLNEQSPYTIHDLNLGYFETKHEAEKIVLSAVKEKKIDAICVNPSTIYGFGDAKKGSRKTQVKVAQGKFPFYTHGGVNVVPVESVVDGVIKAIHKGQSGERYILSSKNLTIKELFEQIAFYAGVKSPQIGIPYSLLKVIGTIGDLTGKGISLENAHTASMFHWFDSTKAQQTISFDPGNSSKAIENSVEWMKNNGYLK